MSDQAERAVKGVIAPLLILIKQWEDKASQAEKYAHYEQAKQLRDCASQLKTAIG